MIFDAEVGDQLFCVNGAGRDPHTVAHNGNFAAFVGAGKAQHTAHVVHFADVFKERFCNVLRAQRSPGISTTSAKSPISALMCGVAIVKSF